jgi:hypothetical protein
MLNLVRNVYSGYSICDQQSRNDIREGIQRIMSRVLFRTFEPGIRSVSTFLDQFRWSDFFVVGAGLQFLAVYIQRKLVVFYFT